ncbi:MAG: uracil phosphoribosyltransferase [Dehalococcoidia bacterium]|nr:uracil phosphoribosyltransferase [Dehalococcoidia bacterium]
MDSVVQVNGLAEEQELLSVLRNRSTPTAEFRGASDRLARVLSAKFVKRLYDVSCTAEDRVHSTDQGVQDFADTLIVPVMRAGLALVPAFTELLPDAPVGIVGVERNEETAEPSLYYERLPAAPLERALIIDPMLATGGTACLIASLLIELGYESGSIHFVGVLAAPVGMDKLSRIIPRPNVTVAAVDQGLDQHNYIVPGLGDYGDRYYGT